MENQSEISDMAEGEFKEDLDKSEGVISRRTFLSLIGGSAAGAIMGRVLVKYFPEETVEAVATAIKEVSLSKESKQKLNEVVEYRRKLGLDGLSPGALRGLFIGEKWQSPSEKLEVDLPEKNKSYGLRIKEIMDNLFGGNSGRLVREVRADSSFPYGMFFDSSSRSCCLSDSVQNIPIEGVFTDYALHEAVGHGSDPLLNLNYPPEILAGVAHGKWRALSRCLSIEGQFLDHPGDLMLPLLKRSIGEVVGRAVVEKKKLRSIVNWKNAEVVRNIVDEIAEENGKDTDELKFNKQVCGQLGGELFQLLMDGKIRFDGELRDRYREEMESVCAEIYAEMVKYALLYPDLIGDDEDVIQGIEEVFSAVKGKAIDISTVRSSVKHPDEDILARNRKETNFLEQNSEDFWVIPLPSLTPDEQQLALEQEKEFKEQEEKFEEYAETGALKGPFKVEDEKKQVFDRFSNLYSTIIKNYPSLKNTFAIQYNTDFDPDLHIWEINEIEAAMDSGFVRQILFREDISEQDLENLRSKTEILDNFVKSDAF